MRNIIDLPEGVNITAKEIEDFVHPNDKGKFNDTLNKRLNTVANTEEQRTFYDPIDYRIIKRNGTNLFLKEYGVLYYKNNKPYISVWLI